MSCLTFTHKRSWKLQYFKKCIVLKKLFHKVKAFFSLLMSHKGVFIPNTISARALTPAQSLYPGIKKKRKKKTKLSIQSDLPSFATVSLRTPPPATSGRGLASRIVIFMDSARLTIRFIFSRVNSGESKGLSKEPYRLAS